MGTKKIEDLKKITTKANVSAFMDILKQSEITTGDTAEMFNILMDVAEMNCREQRHIKIVTSFLANKNFIINKHEEFYKLLFVFFDLIEEMDEIIGSLKVKK